MLKEDTNMNRFNKTMGLMLIAAAFAGCGGDDGGLPDVPGTPGGGGGAPDPITAALAEQCGIDIECTAGGIAEGNASISGDVSIDAFFQSVLNFKGRADMVASGIDAEVSAIGAAFGIEGDVAAGLQAQISANLEGGLKVEAQPAKCEVDAQASVQASARCEGMVNPGSVMVECEGGCEAEASAELDCGASADVSCTFTGPSITCEGGCEGTCTLEAEAAADCTGTCKGTCMGTCSLMNAAGQCEGACEGTCMGSCEAKFEASAMCMGSCNGSCTKTNPEGGCEGAVRASCEAKAGAKVMCDGRCTGNVTPPSASVECQASAKAEASLNVECSPPRVAITYQFKAGIDASAQAQFEAGIRSLEAHLPALLASLSQGEIVIGAGVELGDAAANAVGEAVGKIKGGANFRLLFGLRCALAELGTVKSTLTAASGRLSGSADAASGVVGAFDMN